MNNKNVNKSRPRVVLLKGSIKELDFKIDLFIDFLIKNNIDYYVIDIEKKHSYDCNEFYTFISCDNCCMFTYNNVGILLSSAEGNVWKNRNIPVYTYLVDHPRNFGDALVEPVCDINVLCCDRKHVEFVNLYYTKIKHAYFVPQAGLEVNSGIPIRNRPVDVIYMGSNIMAGVFPPISLLEDSGNDFYNTCVTRLYLSPELSTEEVVDNYFEEKNIKISNAEKMYIHMNYDIYIEYYVRREYKFQTMHALDNEGIHVEIYGGNSWIDEKKPYSSNIVIHDRIPVRDLLDEVGRAKISLCFIPWFKEGCSEKNYDSMLNGALCVTDESEYLKERYVDGHNIIYFDLRNPKQLALDIKWLLEHEDALESIAYRGYCTAKAYDTWYSRYEYIYDLISGSLWEERL